MTPFESLHDDKFPWWVKAIYIFGIPGALSIFLIWLLATRIDTKIMAIEESMRLQRIDIQYGIKTSQEQIQIMNRMTVILQRICVNNAETVADRNACFDSK